MDLRIVVNITFMLKLAKGHHTFQPSYMRVGCSQSLSDCRATINIFHYTCTLFVVFPKL